MTTTWTGESLKIRRRTLKAIDAGIAAQRRPATAKALRDSMQWQPDHMKAEGEQFFGVAWHKLGADQLFQISYAISWAKAYNRSVREYFLAGLHAPLAETEDLFA